MGFHLTPLKEHDLGPPEAAIDGHFAGRLTDDLLWELKGWVVLPVAALAIAGLMAVLVALLRIPGVEAILPWTSQTFFVKGLIAHVTFAFVIWYLGVQGALTVLVTAATRPMTKLATFVGRIGLSAAGLSFLVILTPVLLNLGEPSANNYIPVLIHPIFFAGLMLLALGLALPVIRLLAQIAGERSCEPVVFAVAASGVIFLIALVCLVAAWWTMPVGMPATDAAERVFWGMGHVMQFANTLLFLIGFFLLSRMSLGETPVSDRVFKIVAAAMVAGAAVGPLFYLSFPADDPSQVNAFTDLYWYALPLPAGVVLLGTFVLFLRRARDVKSQTPEVIGLWVALLLFGFGGLIGFFESSVDTRTPAHYHAELIGVTLVFMCLYFALFAQLLDRPLPARKWRIASYVLLGTGQLFHSVGLFSAGLDGVARKVAGGEQGLDSATKLSSMAFMGLGGLIAVIGGVIFVVLASRCLLIQPTKDALDTLEQTVDPA
ncbi:MAG: cbb3-type cytochrome c oxidase subunit I [Rhodospirillaceae bacterium]|nr:cbb3-type cytochrome c oxidase subunit I [Rhodospirillaceae bacterium]